MGMRRIAGLAAVVLFAVASGNRPLSHGSSQRAISSKSRLDLPHIETYAQQPASTRHALRNSRRVQKIYRQKVSVATSPHGAVLLDKHAENARHTETVHRLGGRENTTHGAATKRGVEALLEHAGDHNTLHSRVTHHDQINKLSGKIPLDMDPVQSPSAWDLDLQYQQHLHAETDQPEHNRKEMASSSESESSSEGIGAKQHRHVMYYHGSNDVVSVRDLLYALGGGTGAAIGGTGNIKLDLDLVRRMRYQDEAVMMLLLSVYFITLFFSATFAYRQVANNSSILYYADPRYHNNVCDSDDVEGFLEEFNQMPNDVHMQITGFVPSHTDELPGHIIEWRDEFYYIAFTFSLDLSPWVTQEVGVANRKLPIHDVIVDENGVVVEDREKLRRFLERDTNDLGAVDLVKSISWVGWEELATNIKLCIRQGGFNGIIGIQRKENDTMTVYKNKQWANFMHSRTLKVLCALSIVGWMLYVPYMYQKCRRLIIRCFHKVDLPIAEYWPLIADHLQETGFHVPANAFLDTVLEPGERRQSEAWMGSNSPGYEVPATEAADEFIAAPRH